MAAFRQRALDEASSHKTERFYVEKGPVSQYFGQNVFDLDKMRGYMSQQAYEAVLSAVKFGAKLDRSVANEIASGMKSWAIEMGATHYTHMFQPLTDATAEKHEAFISVKDGKALGAAPPKKALAAALNADGPLYAFSPLTPSITMVYGGVVIDKEARVLEPDERVIRGLFAAGETVNLYYQDYHGGGILAQCLAFGRLAGEGAAAAAKKAVS